jgi:hypothetical protein
MTLEEARALVFSAGRRKSTVISAYEQRDDRSGDYLVVIEPVEGDREVFIDAVKGYMALAEWSGKSMQGNVRYLALGVDGVQRECDIETWKKDVSNRSGTKIPCSSDVEAMIGFLGMVFPAMDEKEVKPWFATFVNLKKEEEQYGDTSFATFEAAKAFVDKYVAAGCPPKDSEAYRLFMAEQNGSDAEFK